MKFFPQEFVLMLREHYGETESAALLDALSHEPPTVSIRLNNRVAMAPESPSSPPPAPPEWGERGGTGGGLEIPWCPLGRLLPTRPRFILDPLLHSGAYYVQEAASMFLWHALSTALTRLALAPATVLDLCASPGGKSTLARSLLSSDCLLVANETIASRTQPLVENLSKWGHHNVVITSAAAEAFADLGPLFDVVIADVPCSGEGLFRRSEEAISQWSREKVLRCRLLQRSIVESAWQALRPGGLLIYSTCTFNPLEDEDNVDWICENCGGATLDLQPPADWQILPAQHSPNHSYHFLPHRTAGEGFFISAIRKQTSSTAAGEPPAGVLPQTDSGGRHGHGRTARKERPVHGSDKWVAAGADIFALSPNQLCLFPERHRPLLSLLQKRGVRLLQVGTPFALSKSPDRWVPLQPLAHSPWLNADAFPQVELSLDEALLFLRGQALTLPPHTPRGYTLVCYRSQPLGFVNNIGSRANNLYPSAWRIRLGQ